MPMIICQMCNKENPDDLEFCKYCQAKLTPLPPSSASQDNQPGITRPFVFDDGMDETGTDWLKDLRTGEEDELSEPEDDLSESVEVPSWAHTEELKPIARTQPGESGADENISWLDEIFQGTGDDQEPLTGRAEGELGGEIPDWLQDLRERHQDNVEDLDDEIQPSEIHAGGAIDVAGEDNDLMDELPGWLAGMDESDESPSRESELPSGEFDFEQISQIAGVEGEPDEFDDGDVVDLVPDAEKFVEINTSQTSPFLSLDRDSIPEEMIQDLESDIETLYPSDMPDWLSEVTEDEPESETEVVEETGMVADEKELLPADLPPWIESLHPEDSTQPPVLPKGKERTAPKERETILVNLDGTIPAELDVVTVFSPVLRTTELQISDTNQTQINLLRNIFKFEGDVIAKTPRMQAFSMRLLRWIISLVLIGAMFGTVVYGKNKISLPSLFPPETIEMARIIGNLPEKSLALISFDYDPGLSGEMEAIAESVIDHLMVKGTHFAVVSTTPSGYILAEAFIKTMQKEHHYVAGEQYINLGYLPGHATGIYNFVVSPTFTKPYSIDGAQAWDSKVLSGVSTINDFDLILVISETAINARTWIEQTETQLLNTPLIMVTSAQAEPLIRPYYENESKQVDAMVSGLSGGAGYEQLTGRSGLNRLYWDSFNAGLIAAVILILIGTLWNLITVLRTGQMRL